MKTLRIILFTAIVLALASSVFAQSQKPLAQNFSVAGMEGETIDLEALRGKVVLLTFWSTTCAICEAEMPQLNQMAASYKGRDVVFLAVTNENATKIENFLSSRRFDFTIIPSGFGVLLKYADRDRDGRIIMGFPAYFVINQNGEIELKDSGWNKITKVGSLIDRLLVNQSKKAE